ncbi:UDP-N-acetylmuramate dehydrogenase [candidate division WS5 bacterium]|uniref:UDP-N-acetylenolpyruvoylglucosamine reductase n=1 Tax=candidate division WS5 bacterium TaxID=2093353 RepID=A0A419DAE7_9BACT|nr:MAG: UDP-N-acetylmuramate dehydrogenase [candidate division WS5 bacterium]
MKIEKDIDLKRYNTYGVGGNARYFVLAREEQDLINAFTFAKEKNISFIVLGKGSNVLISEKGFDGLVIINNTREIKKDNEILSVSSGASLALVTKFTISEGLSGIEFLAGVPGTFGGAIIGNAGCYFGEIADLILDVEIIDGEGMKKITKKEARFSYRDSIFKHDFQGIILSARLKLNSSTKEKVSEKSLDIIKKRSIKDPKGRTSGSFFKNIEVKNAPKKLLSQVETRGMDGHIPTGKLIDEAGCKGMRVGDAEVSTYNAGFIINTGNATADDIKKLAEEVKKRVYDKFGVELEPEVRYL